MDGVLPVNSAQAGDTPAIFLVLPAYIGERFLGRALDSIFGLLRQSLRALDYARASSNNYVPGP